MKVSSNWFRESFGEDYRVVYGHRNEDEARLFADLIRSSVKPSQGGLALDLGCGTGRYLPYLEGYQWMVGMDLSEPLLRIAQRTNRYAPLVRADMRSLPFRAGTFALVVNLFTSFGYFFDDVQNCLVLAEVARVTAPLGWFVLDFFNTEYLRRTLVRFDRRQLGSCTVEQHREISHDGRYVQKAIKMVESDRIVYERVRMFDLKDLLAMVENSGFHIVNVFGDYRGGRVTTCSPRTILVAQRWRSSTVSAVAAGELAPIHSNRAMRGSVATRVQDVQRNPGAQRTAR